MRSDILQMGDIKRELNFPYQVLIVGQYHGVLGYQTKQFPSDQLEVCLRLTSSSSSLEHWIDGIAFHNKFPHVHVKMPRMECRNESLDSRNTFFFIYSAKVIPRLKEERLLDDRLVWDIAMTPELNQFVSQIQESMEHSHEYGVADQIDLLCFQILSRLVLEKREPRERIDSKEQKIRKIASYLKFHFMEDIDFNELVRVHGLSRRTFFRHWLQYMDKSPAKYVNELKLQEACRLLIGTDEKIGWISEYLNFQEENYFCAIFKKYLGMTPKQYRKKRSDQIQEF